MNVFCYIKNLQEIIPTQQIHEYNSPVQHFFTIMIIYHINFYIPSISKGKIDIFLLLNGQANIMGIDGIKSKWDDIQGSGQNLNTPKGLVKVPWACKKLPQLLW